MPILDIEVVVSSEEPLPGDLAEELASAAAEALKARPEGTWVKLRSLQQARYAEGDGGPPAGVKPVFVSVLQADRRGSAELRGRAARLSAAVAQVCDRPEENVHVIFEPSAAGRIWFGGRTGVED